MDKEARMKRAIRARGFDYNEVVIPRRTGERLFLRVPPALMARLNRLEGFVFGKWQHKLIEIIETAMDYAAVFDEPKNSVRRVRCERAFLAACTNEKKDVEDFEDGEEIS